MHAIAMLYLTWIPRLVRALRRDFPAASAEAIEDAVSEAWLACQQRPAPFLAAEARSHRRLYGLFRCVAWRALRGALRRHGARHELADPAFEAYAAPEGQELAAGFAERLPRLMDEATRSGDPVSQRRLRAALEDKVLSGDTDVEIAARHGVARESLNRAKRRLQRGLWDGAMVV